MTADRARLVSLANHGAAAVWAETPSHPQPRVFFNRSELSAMLRVYGRMVIAGHWRDYAIEGREDVALFAVFRRSGETPLYRIEKRPGLRAVQGGWSVVGRGGAILRRGHELAQVLRIFDRARFRIIG